MTCIIPIVVPFFTADFDYRLLRFLDKDIGPTAGVIAGQGILTPPEHLISALECTGVRVCPLATLNLGIFIGVKRLITVCSFSPFYLSYLSSKSSVF